MSELEHYYHQKLLENGFQEVHNHSTLNTIGKVYSIPEKIGKGVYWFYSQKNLYDIKIHDFYFYEDSLFDLQLKEGLGICYYESISGEEISPYHPLTAHSVKCFIGSPIPCKTIVHKEIPLRTIDIEIKPAYYEKYLHDIFPNESMNPHEVFRNITWVEDFPNMITLLHQVKNYRGTGLAAKLFYDSKVAEALSIIMEYNQTRNAKQAISITLDDRNSLAKVLVYIDNNFINEIIIEDLCHIACMGRTKFKTLFKQMYECTVTEYILCRRMNRAETLLSTTDFTIEQIADTIGYRNAGRFASAFKKNTGLFPAEYRKMTQKK